MPLKNEQGKEVKRSDEKGAQVPYTLEFCDKWKFGSGVVVSVGDLVDRGSQSYEVIELMMDLQAQAKAAGGEALVFVFGMCWCGKWFSPMGVALSNWRSVKNKANCVVSVRSSCFSATTSCFGCRAVSNTLRLRT